MSMHSHESATLSSEGPHRRAFGKPGTLLLGMVLAVVSYALIPLLIPTGWVEARVTDQLSSIMNRPVHIDGLTISYEQGIHIESLSIERRDGFSQGRFASAERISIPVSWPTFPLRLLGYITGAWQSPFPSLHVRKAECWVVRQDDQLNIADLNDRDGARLAAYSFQFDDATLHIVSGDDTQSLMISAAECDLDPRTGKIRWVATARTNAAPQASFHIDGHLTSPRLNRDAPLKGHATLQWQDAEVRALLPASLAELDWSPWGMSSGTLTMSLSEHFTVESTARIEFEDLGSSVSNRSLQWTGTWDIANDELEVTRLEFEDADQLTVTNLGDAPAVRLDTTQWQTTHVSLAGRAQQWSELRKYLPPLGTIATHTGLVQGPFSFELSHQPTNTGRRFELAVEGRDLTISVPNTLSLKNDTDKRLAIVVDEQQGAWHIKDVLVHTPLWHFSARGTWPLPSMLGDDNLLSRWLAEGHGMISVEASELGVFLNQPALSKLGEHITCQGPGSIELSHAAEHSTWSLDVSLSNQTRMTVGSVLQKPVGHALHGRILVQPQDDDAYAVQCSAQFGAARVNSHAESNRLLVFTSMPQSKWDVETLNRGVVQAHCSMPVSITGVEQWAQLLSPVARHELLGHASSWAGDIFLTLQVRAGLEHHKPVLKIRADCDVRDLAIDVGTIFSKQSGQPGTASVDALIDRRGDVRHDTLSASLSLDSGTVSLHRETGDGDSRPRGWVLECDALHSGHFLSHWPGIAETLAGIKLDGKSQLQAQWMSTHNATYYLTKANLTNCAIRVPQMNITKQRGTRCTIELETTIPQSASARMEVERARLRLSGASVMINGGSITYGTDLKQPSLSWLADTPATAQVSGLASVDLDSQVRSWLSDIGIALPFSAQGRAEFELTHAPEHTDVSLELLVPQLRSTTHPTANPVDVHVLADVQLPRTRRQPFTFNPLTVTLNEHNRVTMKGHILPRYAQDSPLAGGSFSAVLDLGRLQDIPIQWLPYDMSGSVRATLEGTVQDTHLDITRSHVIWDDVIAQWHDQALAIAGDVSYDSGAWRSESLSIASEDWQAITTFELPWSRSTVFDIRLESFQDDLRLDTYAAPLVQVSDMITQITGGRITQTVAHSHLLQQPINGHIHVDHMSFPDLCCMFSDSFEQVHGYVSIADRAIDATLGAALHGGHVELCIQGPLDSPNQQVSARGMFPDDAVSACLRRVFPGVRAEGLTDFVHADRDATIADPSVVSQGEIIIEGGVLQGKAAPAWVTRIFPGLNLASFRFVRMHDWFTVLADGRQHHQALFKGKYYHLYADGWVYPEGQIEHEIGIDVLGGLDSEYWTSSGSGRLPLIQSTTQLDDQGQVLEEQVTYVPLRSVEAILWGANPIRTAYHVLKQRVLESKKQEQ